jgi:hypothetical protein
MKYYIIIMVSICCNLLCQAQDTLGDNQKALTKIKEFDSLWRVSHKSAFINNKSSIISDSAESPSKVFLLKNLTEYKWTALLITNSKDTAYASITWIFDKNGTKKISIFTHNSLEEVIKHINILDHNDFKDFLGTYISPNDLSKGVIHSINLLNEPEEIKELSDSLLVFAYPSNETQKDSYNIFYIRGDYVSDINFVKRHLSIIPKDSTKRIK